MYLSVSKEYDKLQEVLINGIDYLKKANFTDYPPHMLYRFAGNGSYGINDYETAISYYEKYLDSKNPKEGATNYEQIVNMLSVAYILSGYPDKAQKLLKLFLKDNEDVIIVSNPVILANIYHNLGRAIMLSKHYKDALIYLNKSKDLQMKLYGEATSRTIDYINECVDNK
jgi:tetratricopeptide (TPR) repeat protein